MPTFKQAHPSVQRIESIDVLRGTALLGIFLMNANTFAMPLASYLNPMAYGGQEPLNLGIHGALHLLADQKFMALFGAGVLLIFDGRRHRIYRTGDALVSQWCAWAPHRSGYMRWEDGADQLGGSVRHCWTIVLWVGLGWFGHVNRGQVVVVVVFVWGLSLLGYAAWLPKDR